MYIANWSSTRMPNRHKKETIISLTDAFGKTGYGFSCTSVAIIKYPYRKQLGVCVWGQGVIHLTIPDYNLSYHENHRAANHIIISTVKSRVRIHVCMLTCLSSVWFVFFYTVQDSGLGNCATHSGLGLFTSNNLIKTIPHRHGYLPTQCGGYIIETFPRGV